MICYQTLKEMYEEQYGEMYEDQYGVANSKAWLLWLVHTFPLLCLIQCIVSSVFTSLFFLIVVVLQLNKCE